MRACLRGSALAAIGLLAAAAMARGDTPAEESAPRLRQPVALAVFPNPPQLFVACRDGQLMCLDLSGDMPTLARRERLGQQLADLAALRDDWHLLAVDESAHELLLVSRKTLQAVARRRVAAYPVSVKVLADGRHAAVASLWSRRLTIVRLDVLDSGLPRLEIERVVDLPFAPRAMQPIDAQRLAVADAFGGQLALVQIADGRIAERMQLPGHNIRGLALGPNGRELLVSHQVLNSKATTTRGDVFWGGVMANLVRYLPLDQLRSDVEPAPLADAYPLGDPHSATGDPAAVLVTPRGQTAVAISGTNEIALRPTPREPFVRLPAGTCPTALAYDSPRQRILVANTLSDSISVIDPQALRVVGEVPLGAPPELTAAQRGQRLFFDARLSLSAWFSCHSCHTDGHSNQQLNDNFSDGHFGAPKRVLSLLGTADTAPWAWNGTADSLAQQVRSSVAKTMQGKPLSESQVQDLVAYLNTLPPPPGIDRARGTVNEPRVAKGRAVFEAQGCAACHRPPRYTTPATYDVNLHDEQGSTRFNPPSLFGVSQRDRLFHDGRARSLREVVVKFRHGVQDDLSAEQIEDLLAFLRSL